MMGILGISLAALALVATRAYGDDIGHWETNGPANGDAGAPTYYDRDAGSNAWSTPTPLPSTLSIPASSLFTKNRMQTLQAAAGSAPATTVMLVPQDCKAQVCITFFEFWTQMVAAYPGHVFFVQCGSGKMCGEDIKNPQIMDFVETTFQPYKGGKTLDALMDHVCTLVKGPAACNPNYVWAKQYTFSDNWFTQNVPRWETWFAELVGTPCRVLEIGSYEGLATCWLVDHVLTHPDAHITTVDPFMRTSTTLDLNTFISDATAELNFKTNVALSKSPEKVTSFVGISQHFYDSLDRKAARGTFDAIYIDGSHVASDVLIDVVACWDLLKPGGIIIFDDYETGRYNRPGGFRGGAYTTPKTDQVQPYDTPGLAIDSFTSCFEPYIEVVYEGYQKVIRKKAISIV